MNPPVGSELLPRPLLDARCEPERAVDPNYGKGMIFGGRWFEDRGTKQIWRLVPPDFLFRGLWEKVDLNAN
jgi:hypothetical protein